MPILKKMPLIKLDARSFVNGDSSKAYDEKWLALLNQSPNIGTRNDCTFEVEHTSYRCSTSLQVINVDIWMADPTAVRGTIPSKPRHNPRTPCCRKVVVSALIVPEWLCWKPTANFPCDWAWICVLTMYSGQPTAAPATPQMPPQNTINGIECSPRQWVKLNLSTVSYSPRRVLFNTNWKANADPSPSGAAKENVKSKFVCVTKEQKKKRKEIKTIDNSTSVTFLQAEQTLSLDNRSDGLPLAAVWLLDALNLLLQFALQLLPCLDHIEWIAEHASTGCS